MLWRRFRKKHHKSWNLNEWINLQLYRKPDAFRRHILSPSPCDYSKRPRQYIFSIEASTDGLTKSLAWDELETVFRVGSSFHCSYLKCMRGMFHAKTNLKLGNCSSRIFRLFTILSQQTGELIRLHTVCCQRQVTFYTLHIIFYKTFK